MRSFYYTADINFSEEFLLHSSYSFYLMLERNTHHDVFARSYGYSLRAGFSEEFLLQSS